MMLCFTNSPTQPSICTMHTQSGDVSLEASNRHAAFQVGQHLIDPPLVLAPMAGITDLPFRRICRRFGLGLVVTEMIASRAIEYGRERTVRMAQVGEDEHPAAVQIAGSDPKYMQEAARWAVSQGADFVDINMGCPVKKICKQVAGSAMLRDEKLVGLILDTVVAAVDVPVTLKIRTGWDENSKNMRRIARIAEDAGVQMLTVHGRTRSQMFNGHANWEDIGEAKSEVRIPVVGNGDVVGAESAKEMMAISGCDGVMVGRAVQGNPWVLGEVSAMLKGQPTPPQPTGVDRWVVVHDHLQQLLIHHGERTASKLARKHVPWYSKGLAGSAEFRMAFQQCQNWEKQLLDAQVYFEQGHISHAT